MKSTALHPGIVVGLFCGIGLFCGTGCKNTADGPMAISAADSLPPPPDTANLPALPAEDLAKGFKDPGKDYGSAPLWVWNTHITKGLIDTALQGFKDNGFGGVFVHPRPGLITEYLSPAWFDLWAYATQKAKSLGLNIWIYDEDSYPSGFAGGHVPDAMPSSYNQGEMLEMDTITHQFKKTFYYTSPWYGGFSYVDLMVPGVTNEFIRQTMTGYEHAVGDEFGKTVKGIFSDEPNIEVQASRSIRWTPELYPAFYKRWGYHLEDKLTSLLLEEGDYKKVRHDYYTTLLGLFVDGWSKPYSAYATSKNLEWTGHYWEHEWPDPNHVPDNMEMYAWPQRPGIDLLFNQFDEHGVNAQFGNIRSVKELASVADELGKARTLCETYGGGGWDLSFQDMKRLGDWEFALGINTLDQHLADLTITGARKYDYPQSFSYHEPWWPYYKYLNNYFTRLSWALTRGEQRDPVLVLEPTTTAWMYDAHDWTTKRLHEVGQGFQDFVTHLEKAQVEYDLGSEAIIRDNGRTDGARFIVGKRAYTTVVIPPGMENLDSSTDALLKKYVAAGGRLLQYEDVTRLDGAEAKVAYSGPRVQRLDTGASIQTPKAYGAPAWSWVHPWLQPAGFGLWINSGGGDLHHQRRLLDGEQLLFLSNASLDSSLTGTFYLPGQSVQVMNLVDGSITPVEKAYDDNRGNRWVPFSLAPGGSVLYLVSQQKGPAPGARTTLNALAQLPPTASQAPSSRQDTIPMSPTRALRPAVNSLMVDFCDVHIGDTLLKDKHVFYAADTVFKHYGFTDGNPWNTSVQYKDNTVRRDTFSVGTGFTATYHIQVGPGVNTAGFRAVVEQPGLWSVTINGHPVTAQKGQWWLDRAWGVYAAGAFLHPGDNELSVKANRMSVYAEIEPVYILGDFNLDATDKGWRIEPPGPLALGSWKTQGMPLYGGVVRYESTCTLPHPQGRYTVHLGAWKGTVASVEVNGRPAGINTFGDVDVTSLLKPGENHIAVNVTGSLRNLLGPHHNKPAPGIASPWHWRNVRAYPSGRDYSTLDYGLMQDLTLINER